MENASKALLIAGAILISILIIAIGMYIYSSSQGSINDAISQMDSQTIGAFNKTWTNYEETQTGTQIKSLVSDIMANARTNEDATEKVVNLTISVDGTAAVAYTYAPGATGLSDFITALNGVYNTIQSKHTYTVTVDYEGTPLVRRLVVAY